LPPVAVTKIGGQYPENFPYNPDRAYPEYVGKNVLGKPNHIYHAIRELFRLLGYDREHFGTRDWNPLGFLVRPGDRVFVKPNLVTHEYRASCPRKGNLYSVITHPSVLRVVADYVALALKGKGEILIGDNPSIDADFDKLMQITQLKEFESLYSEVGIDCRVLDLRPLRTTNLDYYGLKSKTQNSGGDPEGESVLNLGKKSLFYGMNPLLFRGVFTKRWETIKHHIGNNHRYSISNTILNSDVYISVPKLKSHHKVGATLNIKGLVGINYNKNHLIHWRIGFPALKGDEFPSPSRFKDYFVVALRHFLMDILPENAFIRLRDLLKGTRLEILLKDTECLSFNHPRGAWEGNDTCWRMAADLYKVFVKDEAGWRRRKGRQIRTFSVIDGVICGEGNGPFCPSEKLSQVIVAGEDLLLVDTVGARLMDYKIEGINYLRYLLKEGNIQLNDIPINSNHFAVKDFFNYEKIYLQFEPPPGWGNLAIANGGVK
jgi:uncharacterized protein (DUF362 family)